MKRRAFLAGAAGSMLVAAGCAEKPVRPSHNPVVDSRPKQRSSLGLHQPGISTPPAAAAMVAALDLAPINRERVASLLQRLTKRISLLRSSPGAGSRVVVTAAVGAALFRERLGLDGLRPRRLTTMTRFSNDVLDPRWCHGDLLLQVCAERPSAARAALRYLLDGSEAVVQPRWSIAGFRPQNQMNGQVATTRNLFGFREGAGNPDPNDQTLMDRLVWVQPGSGEPAWAAGGTYQVVRLIRFATKLWDAEPVEHQEDVFGRHKQTGAPLAGTREDQVPNFAVDPDGRITPLDAHIRRANPRTPETEANRILRRSYSYRRGRDAAGHPNEGLIFVCFQQDLERGFATVQRRLRGEALEKYVLPFGGGYFFVLPAAPPGGYLGQQLLEAAD
jgi:deferrochelatase/peroxidase EfeB